MNTDKRKVMVTGAAGFLGRYVVRYFQERNWNVVGLDNAAPENAPLANLESYHRLQLPATEFSEILGNARPTVLVHCAGRASVGLSVQEPAGDFYSNAVVTFEILNALRNAAPDCRFVLLSSAAVYGNPSALPVKEDDETAPISPYGYHKLISEQLCQEFATLFGVPTAAARIFSAYGPGLRRQVLWDICRKAVMGEEVTLQGSGKESRDFVHAVDIAGGVYLIAEKAPMRGESYNVATGREVTIDELANLTLESVGYPGVARFDGQVPAGNPLNWRADITRLTDLGFRPAVSLERGIATFSTWCRAELVGV